MSHSSTTTIQGTAGRASFRPLFTGVICLASVFFLMDTTPMSTRVKDLGQFRPDGSYMLAQVTLLNNGAQYGRDIVWTYGPLGFLLNDMVFALPEWSLGIVLTRCFLAIVFGWSVATVAMVAATRGTWGLAVAGLVTTGALFCAWATGGSRPPVYWLSFALFAALLRARPSEPCETRQESTVIYLLAIAAAISGLVKFTHLMLGGVVFGGMALVDLSRGRFPRQSTMFLVAFLSGWTLCVQAWTNLP